MNKQVKVSALDGGRAFYHPQDPGLYARVEVLQEGPSAGVILVVLSNGEFEVTIVPSRGMNIYEARHQDDRLGWQSPVKNIIHPSLSGAQSAGWGASFNELIARCGLRGNGPAFDDDGQAYPQHGRISHIPAYDVTLEFSWARQDKPASISVSGTMDEVRFLHHGLSLRAKVTLVAGKTDIELEDTLVNLLPQPVYSQLLYHVNIGPPVLTQGASLHLMEPDFVPRDNVAARAPGGWSKFGAPKAGFKERVYYNHLITRPCVVMHNAQQNKGVRLVYDEVSLPCLSVWVNTASEAEGYVVGIEPGTNFPNSQPEEKSTGRGVELPAYASQVFRLTLSYLSTEHQVTYALQGLNQENAVKYVCEGK